MINYIANELSDELSDELRDTDLFVQIAALDGEIFRRVADRKTIKVILRDQYYFAKLHFGVGWGEIFKNLFQGRLPILGARNEWLALHRLKSFGVPSMEPVVYCEKGWNPATRQSAIITKSLEQTTSLEDYVAPNPVVKRRLIYEVAVIARTMHAAGINHRDFYLCHFLLDIDSQDDVRPQLHLIDLHRAQIRRKVPMRWLIKDLGGLLFSAMNSNLTKRDLLRFLKIYIGAECSTRTSLAEDAVLWRKVKQRAIRLYLQDHPTVPDTITELLDHI